jgi:hypothetical protein
MSAVTYRRRRWVRNVVITAVAVTVAAASVFTIRAYNDRQQQIRAARHVLDDSLAHETELHGNLVAAQNATTTARAKTADRHHRTRNEQASTRHIAVLAAAAASAAAVANASLHTSTLLRAALGASTDVAKSCLDAEQTAMHHLQSADSSAAVAALNSGRSACAGALAGATGARFPYDFPDPFVLTAGGRYYAFSTNSGAGDIQVITSTDLVDWSLVGDALTTVPQWATRGMTWAPSVLHLAATPAQPASPGHPAVPARPEAFVMYYTVRDAASGAECISSAVSGLPAGPYFDRTTAPLVCESADGGSIDPTPFVDTDGSMWMLWKRERAHQPATLRIQQLSANGRTLTGQAFDLLQSDRAWQHGVIEAPTMIHTSAGYFLFFAGGDWSTATYATGVAVCATPIGPCQEHSTPVMASNDTIKGPGGATVFTDRNGAIWLAYASYVNPFVGWPYSRTLRFAKVTISAYGVVVTPV